MLGSIIHYFFFIIYCGLFISVPALFFTLILIYFPLFFPCHFTESRLFYVHLLFMMSNVDLFQEADDQL